MSISNIGALIKDYFNIEITEEKRFLKVKVTDAGVSLTAVEIDEKSLTQQEVAEKIRRKQAFLTTLIDTIRLIRSPLLREGISDLKEIKKVLVVNYVLQKMVEREQEGKSLFEQRLKLTSALEKLRDKFSTFKSSCFVGSSVSERKEHLSRQLPHMEEPKGEVPKNLSAQISSEMQLSPICAQASLSIGSSRPPAITQIPTMRYKPGNTSEDHKSQLAFKEEAYTPTIAKLSEDILVRLANIWKCTEKKEKDKLKTVLKDALQEFDASLVEEASELAEVPLMRLMLQKLSVDFLAVPLRGVHDPLALRPTFISLGTLAHNLVRQSFHIRSSEERIDAIPTSRISDLKMKFEIETAEFTRILTKILSGFPVKNRGFFQQAVENAWNEIRKNPGEINDDSGPLAVETLLKCLKGREIDGLENEENQEACDKCVYLLRAFAQDLYMHPLNEVKRIFKLDKFIPPEGKENILDDFLFAYTLSEAGHLRVECVSQLTYSYNHLFTFTLSIRNQLCSSIDSLPHWESTLRLIVDNVVPTSPKAVEKKNFMPKQLKTHIIEPLFQLGFSVDINDKSITKK